MSQSAVSPFVTTYAQQTPYITVAEFEAAPTAIDISDLVPDGSLADQQAALADVIARASGWADDICNQVLAATVNTERARYRVNRYGYVRVPLRYKPVLEVVGIKVGLRVAAMTTFTDFTNVQVNKYSVDIPAVPSVASVPCIWGVGADLLVEVQYVNGWCNALLTTDVLAGATTLLIAPTEGVYPGTALRISDGVQSEVVTVASSYVSGSSIPLLAPTSFAHATGVSVSNLPVQVKQATVLLTAVLIQTRGDDAIILDSVENPTRLSDTYGASGTNVALAMSQLNSLMRVW